MTIVRTVGYMAIASIVYLMLVIFAHNYASAIDDTQIIYVDRTTIGPVNPRP